MRLRILPLLLVLLVASVPPTAPAAADPTAPGVGRWVEATFDLAQPTFTRIDLTGKLLIHKYTVEDRTYTASDMHDAFIASPDDTFVKDLEAAAREGLEASLAEAFPDAQRTIVSVVVDRASLAAPRADAYDPPVKVSVAATLTRTRASLGIGDLSDDAVGAAFEAGARVLSRVDIRAQSGYFTTFVLHAPAQPEGIVFASETVGAILGVDGRTAIVTRDATRSTTDVTAPVTLALKSGAAPPAPTGEEASLTVTVDLKDLDVTIGGASQGDFGTLKVDVDVTGDINVLKVPTDVLASFGDNVRLDYITSDGLRLLKEKGVVSARQVDEVESKLLARIRQGLSASMGATIDVTGGFLDETMDAKLVTRPLSSERPVVFRASATFEKPLAAGNKNDKAALALYTIHQTFDFPRVEGLATTYTVILPRGLAVADLDTEGGSATRGETDGRDSFSVTPTSASATTTAGIAITPTFVMIKFWPIVLLAFLIVLLLVGTPIAIVVVRRRKKAAARVEPRP